MDMLILGNEVSIITLIVNIILFHFYSNDGSLVHGKISFYMNR
jgi:hypothetical protein